MAPLNPVFADRPTTIFEVMSSLAREHGAINLGQGAPDEDGPADILRVAAEATIEGPNQYPSMWGVPELQQAVAEANRRFYDIEVDWRRETLVTVGATEGLAAAMLALLQPGDEAILLEPFYDSYAAMIEAAGARVRCVQLTPPNWDLPEAALEAAFTDKTKLLVVNTPLNPIGKVFTREELGVIARLAEKHDIHVVCDEVYEHLVYDGRVHTPLLALPGMRERVVRIGSAGKAFSLTGWKIGYVSGPERLIGAIAKAHQFLVFTVPPNLQKGVAYGLRLPDSYFEGYTKKLAGKRDLLAGGLRDIGLKVMPCEGAYFLHVDIADLGFDGDDAAFCKKITVEAKVAAVPVSAFYHPDTPDPPRNFVRFCFCKQDDQLAEGVRRLGEWLGR